MKKLIIIPAYNESANIEKTVASIKKDAKGFDYVIINDCSVDNTRKICEDNGFNIVNLPINLGIGGAVQTGYRYAYEHGYDVAVQVDGDGQHDPEFLDTMAVYLVDHNLDMVIGSRFIEKKGFLYAENGNQVFYRPDQIDDRKDDNRSDIRVAYDRKKCNGTVCV
mgnify:CR=1 FL=1